MGLMNFKAGAINWRIVTWALSSWVFTIPVAGGIAGLLLLLTTSGPKA